MEHLERRSANTDNSELELIVANPGDPIPGELVQHFFKVLLRIGPE